MRATLKAFDNNNLMVLHESVNTEGTVVIINKFGMDRCYGDLDLDPECLTELSMGVSPP